MRLKTTIANLVGACVAADTLAVIARRFVAGDVLFRCSLPVACAGAAGVSTMGTALASHSQLGCDDLKRKVRQRCIHQVAATPRAFTGVVGTRALLFLRRTKLVEAILAKHMTFAARSLDYQKHPCTKGIGDCHPPAGG